MLPRFIVAVAWDGKAHQAARLYRVEWTTNQLSAQVHRTMLYFLYDDAAKTWRSTGDE